MICSSRGCRSESSDREGKVCVPVSQAGDYVFHATESKINGTHHGDVLFPISISTETVAHKGVQDLGTVTMPRVGPTSILAPGSGGTFALGGGFTLTVPAGVATPPPFEKKIELARLKLHGQAALTQNGAVVDVKGKGLKLLGWFLFYKK